MKAKVVKATRSIVSAGVHNARIHGIYDLGTQKDVYNGKVKEQHKVYLSAEITDESFELEDGEQVRYAVGKEYAMIITSRSNLKKDAEAIGRIEIAMPEEGEEAEFDISTLMGKDCQVLIEHSKSAKTGETYANIKQFISTPKDKTGKFLKIEPLEREKVLFDLEEFDADAFAKVPGWLQEKIKASTEYKENVLLDDEVEKTATTKPAAKTATKTAAKKGKK